MHSFEVHSNESTCRKSRRLGMDQVLMPTKGKKGHAFMNQNLRSYSCLIIITFIMNFHFIISTYATSSSR